MVKDIGPGPWKTKCTLPEKGLCRVSDMFLKLENIVQGKQKFPKQENKLIICVKCAILGKRRRHGYG